MQAVFPRPKPESWQSRLLRYAMNLTPVYFGTGGVLTYIAPDWREVHLALPLSWRTRNYVGTLFGGSMYAALDPIYMLMLIKNLGPGYVVWDKAACIQFKRPGRQTLYARFVLSEEELAYVRRLAETQPSLERVYPVELVDRQGEVHAFCEKTLYIRKKSA